ncbi:tetratricopeptide repeat protein [Moorellaceae bacterium AZ2]
MRKDKLKGCFLLLDGSEKEVVRILRKAGLEESEVLFPLFPDSTGSQRTVWWASAAQLMNSFKAKGQSSKVFYWGPMRFLRLFLREFSNWDRSVPVIWSQWERVQEDGVARFYGGLGAFLPGDVELPELPTYLGNRFFGEILGEALAGIGCTPLRRGRPWPIPEEELRIPKGVQRVTLAMIVKDEEQFLAGCLEQALPFVDSIVVVDTGSNDRTPEVAARYGARLLSHEWRGDFAAARNVYLDEIQDGWVLTLDADEYLTPEAGAWLRRLAERGEPKVYFLRTYNYHSEFLAHFSDQANIRLFWRAPDACYAGKIHEQLISSLPRVLLGGPYVVHYGYLPGVLARKKKISRNVEILEEVTTEQRESPFDWYNYGLSLLSSGKAAEALQALEQYFALESSENLVKRPSAFWQAARAALACGRKELALEYAEKACAVPLPECYFRKGEVLEALGRVEEAIDAYRTAASLPEPPASLYEMMNQTDASIKLWRAHLAAGVLLEKEKRYAEAEREYKQALQKDVANIFALLGVARIKRLQEKPREALKWARRAVDAMPNALEPYLECLEALVALGDFEAAREHITQARISPFLKNKLWLRLAGEAIEAEEWLVALESSEKVLEHEMANVVALVARARALKGLGRLKEAEEALREAPALPDVANERGCIALAQARLDEAEEIFRAILAKDPIYVPASINLAQVLILKGRVREALELVYPFAVSESGENCTVRAALLAARCLNSLQRYYESLTLLNMIDENELKTSEKFEIYLVRGNALFGLERLEEAADSYLEAYSLNPHDPELLFRIGLLMLKLERWEDAENAFLGTLRADPGNQQANYLLQVARQMRVLAQK